MGFSVSPIDLVTLASFAGFGLLAWLASRLYERQRHGARARVRERAMALGRDGGRIDEQESETLSILRRHQRRLPDRLLGQQLAAIIERVETVAGRRGVKVFIALPLLLAGLLLLAEALLLRLSWLQSAALVISVAGVTYLLLYRFFERRFQRRFLKAFPDALDLITRAVRSGIPVGAAIESGADELTEPVRAQFLTIANSLRLGIDMNEVMTDAAARIRVADFNFFAVCLLLQRETGGFLADTLDNLAGIIRARRELQMKARALTGEGRAASQVIGVIPFVAAGVFSTAAPEYFALLYQTELGRKLLITAAIMLVIGFTIINRLSRLEP